MLKVGETDGNKKPHHPPATTGSAAHTVAAVAGKRRTGYGGALPGHCAGGEPADGSRGGVRPVCFTLCVVYGRGCKLPGGRKRREPPGTGRAVLYDAGLLPGDRAQNDATANKNLVNLLRC